MVRDVRQRSLRPNMLTSIRRKLLWIVALAVWCGLAIPAYGYVDFSPTLGQLIKDSTHIVVIRVDKVSQEKRAILFQKVADLKGKFATEQINHQITDGTHPREPHEIMEWAEPGQTAIFFVKGTNFVACLGRSWYQGSLNQSPWWTMTSGRPELSLAYYGSTQKLKEHVAAILDGKEVVITAVRYLNQSRETRRAAIFRTVRGRDNPIVRTKASLKMPVYLYETSNDPKYHLGSAANAEDVPDLLKRLQGTDVAIRVEAAREMGDLGEHAKAAVPALVEALGDPAAPIRKAAAAALGSIGAPAAVPALTKTLRDADAKVRWQAAEALGQIGPKASAAVPELVKVLQGKDVSIRSVAADALGAIGWDARAAIPTLKEALKDPELGVRLTAATALLRVDVREARATVPLFFAELKKTSDTRIRLNYLHYLGMVSALGCGDWDKDWVPTLVDVVRTDPFWVDRVSAAGLLTAMASADAALAQYAVPGILVALKVDPDSGNRFEVARMLGQEGLRKHVGKNLAAVVGGLTEALQDKDAGVRIEAARALQAYGPAAHTAVAALTKLLEDQHPDVRSSAAKTLKAIQEE